MSESTIVILGHSHLGVVREALKNREPRTDVVGAKVFVHDVWKNQTHYAGNDDQGRLVFNHKVMASIDAIVPTNLPRHYVSMLGGNGHVVFSISKHARPFDFVIPEAPDLPLDQSCEVLPFDYVAELLKPHMMPYIWQLVSFRQTVDGRVTQLETPPPYGDDEYVRNHLGTYVADPNNVVSRWQRLKLWRLHSSIMRDICAANDVDFIAVPDIAQDSDGFMHRDGYGLDATHANSWYGERLLEQLEKLVGASIVGHQEFAEG